MRKIELSITEIVQLEKDFALNNYRGNLQKESHSFIKGDKISSIILTAPHTVKTETTENSAKEIREKEEEVYTGAIVLASQHFLGCHAMVRNNYNDVKIDTDFYNQQLQEYIKRHDIKYLVDIHGAARWHPFDIAPGTGYDKYIAYQQIYKDIITVNFIENGLNNIIFGTAFQALGPKTLCQQVFAGTGIKATQLEINRNFRDPLQDIYKLNLLLNGLNDYIKELDKVIHAQLEAEKTTKSYTVNLPDENHLRFSSEELKKLNEPYETQDRLEREPFAFFKGEGEVLLIANKGVQADEFLPTKKQDKVKRENYTAALALALNISGNIPVLIRNNYKNGSENIPDLDVYIRENNITTVIDIGGSSVNEVLIKGKSQDDLDSLKKIIMTQGILNVETQEPVEGKNRYAIVNIDKLISEGKISADTIAFALTLASDCRDYRSAYKANLIIAALLEYAQRKVISREQIKTVNINK